MKLPPQTAHVFEYFTRHCSNCGASKIAVAVGKRSVECPGGLHTNVRQISVAIIERKHAALRTLPPHHKGRTP